MKQSICYLYEYESYKQTKNVGFVKCIFKKDKVTFQIHGKGLDCDKFMDLEMFLFTSNDETYQVDSAGHVEGAQGAVNYMVTVEEMDSEKMNRYDGILLESVNRKQYVAVWKQKAIYLKDRDIPEALVASLEKVVDVAIEEREEIEETSSLLSNEVDASTCGCQGEEANAAMEIRSIEAAEEYAAEIATVGADIQIKDVNEDGLEGVDAEEESVQEESFNESVVKETHVSKEELTYDKINRHGIAALSQREWKWANNNFLLHGYSNYKHLMLIREKGKLYLGIPGVYHKKEETAARSFGFPIFHPIDESARKLIDIEWKEKEQFGYWCRPVTERKGVEQQYDKYEYTR